MSTVKEIKERFDRGYTLSLYGSRELLYEQMLDDISCLLNLFSAQKTAIENRINELEYKFSGLGELAIFDIQKRDLESRLSELKQLNYEIHTIKNNRRF